MTMATKEGFPVNLCYSKAKSHRSRFHLLLQLMLTETFTKRVCQFRSSCLDANIYQGLQKIIEGLIII